MNEDESSLIILSRETDYAEDPDSFKKPFIVIKPCVMAPGL